jgi:hypothetical protein
MTKVKVSALHNSNSRAHLLTGKLYIPTYINKYRVVGCVDSGSDISILQYSVYCKLFKDQPYLDESQIENITTFSNNSVKVLGLKNIKLKLSREHDGFPLTLYIVKDIPNVPIFLIGDDALKAGLGSIQYNGSPLAPQPVINFMVPTAINCQVYHISPQDLFFCTAIDFLEPFEKKTLTFMLPQAAPVIRTDYILITGIELNNIAIIPSKSDLNFSSEYNAYLAKACVVNLSNKTIKDIFHARYEIITDCQIIPLEECRKSQL